MTDRTTTMTTQPRLTHPNGEATNEFLHSVLLNCGLSEQTATIVGVELAGQLKLLTKGDPIAFEELEVGDTIHTVRDWDGMTEHRIGTISKLTGNIAFYRQESGADRLLTCATHEGPFESYLLHRPEKPKPVQLAHLQPGLVLDGFGASWVFDGAYAYRRSPMTGGTDRCPVDEGRNLAPWSQAATLDYNVEGEDDTLPLETPDLAEAAGKRTEYGIRYSDGEVTLRPTAREAVADAKKRGRALGPRHAVEPVTRTNWGSAESAWVPIETAAPEPFKWGTEDPDGQRIYIGKTPDGTMHLGIGLASAQLRGSMAADLTCAILIAIPLAYLAWVALGGHL